MRRRNKLHKLRNAEKKHEDFFISNGIHGLVEHSHFAVFRKVTLSTCLVFCFRGMLEWQWIAWPWKWISRRLQFTPATSVGSRVTIQKGRQQKQASNDVKMTSSLDLFGGLLADLTEGSENIVNRDICSSRPSDQRGFREKTYKSSSRQAAHWAECPKIALEFVLPFWTLAPWNCSTVQNLKAA